jgi:hypothetical protein
MIPHFKDKGKVLQLLDRIWIHNEWKLRSKNKLGISFLPSNTSLQFFLAWKSFE